MSTFANLRTHAPISVLLSLFLLLGVTYSIVTPAFETPDEIWHYAFIHHLASGQGLPISKPETDSLWQQQGVQAPGYYLAAAAITAWIDQNDFPDLYARANPHRAIGVPNAKANYNYFIHHAGDSWPWSGALLALHIARLFSVLLGATTIWAIYRILLLIFPADVALSGAALVAFIPQFLFISAAASNDNAVNALAALVIWRLSVLLTRPPNDENQMPAVNDVDRDSPRSLMREFWLLGILLGLAVLSKLSALGLVFLAGLVVLVLAWRSRTLHVIGQATIGIGIPLVAIGGWWYLRNWQLYGDPMAWNIWQANILLRVQPAGWRLIMAELISLEQSFWGLFGWLNVAYPQPVYTFFRAIEGLVAIGLAIAGIQWMWRSRRIDAVNNGCTNGEPPGSRWLVSILSLLWLVILTISWLRFMRIAPAAQGRYFFPALPAIAILMVLGLDAWRIWILRWLVVLLLFLLTAITPFWLIGPAYEPPSPRLVDLTQLTPVEAHLGDEFSIMGIGVEPDTLLPGQQAHLQLAWQAKKTPVNDYSVFVHLVDEDGLIVAQYDTMPGGGLHPTSQWTTGERRVETYTVSIPSTAYTPNSGHWAIGLYQSTSGPTLQHRLPVTLSTTSPPVDLIYSDGNALHFGAVTIATPPGSIPNPVNTPFRDNITLKGYTFSQRVLRPGDTLAVTLFWAARGAVAEDYTTFVHLLNRDYEMFGGNDDRPEPSTKFWSEEELITDVHSFTIPEQTPPGQYQIELGLYTRPDFDRLGLLESDGVGADRLLLGPLEVRP